MKSGDGGRSRKASVCTSTSASSIRSLDLVSPVINEEGESSLVFTSVLPSRVRFVRRCSFDCERVRACEFESVLEPCDEPRHDVSLPVDVEPQSDRVERAEQRTER